MIIDHSDVIVYIMKILGCLIYSFSKNKIKSDLDFRRIDSLRKIKVEPILIFFFYKANFIHDKFMIIKGLSLGRDAALRAIRRSGILLRFIRDVT